MQKNRKTDAAFKLLLGSALVLGSTNLSFSSENNFAVGVADLRLNADDQFKGVNAVIRGPQLAAGYSLNEFSGRTVQEGFGGFGRLKGSSLHTLEAGYNFNRTGGREQYEAQVLFGLTPSFKFGGGFLFREELGDVGFITVQSWHPRKSGQTLVFNPVVSSVDGKVSAGGYGALYTDAVFVSAGYDGEQWRTTLAAISAESQSDFRPAIEILYVDPTIGEETGAELLFANATLGYIGGFLSNPSRLGRALGPQGLVISNPVSFLSSEWNTASDVWEIGALANTRLIHSKFPNGGTYTSFQTVAFPLELIAGIEPESRFFAGYEYENTRAQSSNGALMGYVQQYGIFHVAIVGRYQPVTDTSDVVIRIKVFP